MQCGTLNILTKGMDNINEDRNTAVILLDVKNAFDTVNHKILLGKFYHYGICGYAYKLFFFLAIDRILKLLIMLNLIRFSLNLASLKNLFLVYFCLRNI